jgi:acyl-CoA thioesterase I
MKTLRVLSILLLSIVFVCCTETKKDIIIVCIGDSITDGAGTQNQSTSAYPAVLSRLLGPDYSVVNSGRGGATMLKKSDSPFWVRKEFSNVFAVQPDIVVIKLGTNDSKDQNWDAAQYAADYQSMIDTLRTMESNPEIFLCSPVPAYKRAWNINDSVIHLEIIPIVEDLAVRNELTVIDLYSPLEGKSELFPDGIHPNEEGAELIARAVKEGIRGE